MSRARKVEPDQLAFWCPGCDSAHVIGYGPGHWTWDGNLDLPTITPSVLVYSRQALINEDLPMPELVAPENVRTTPRCHSFVTAGQIQFLGDSTHALAGQTVPLPEWETRPTTSEGTESR